MSHIPPTNSAYSSGSKRSPDFDLDFKPDPKRRKIEDEHVNDLVQRAELSSWLYESDADNFFEFSGSSQELQEAQKVQQSVGMHFNESKESSKVANPQNPPLPNRFLDARSSSNDETIPNYTEQLSFGKDHYNKGNYGETIKVFENLLAAPNNFDEQTLNDIQYDLAHSYYQLGIFQEALDSFSKVSGLDPRIATVHMWKGFCCAALRLNTSEEKYFRQALKIFNADANRKSDPTVQYQMGICCFSLNQIRRAKICFGLIKPGDPNYKDAQYYLGHIEDKIGDYDAAITHLLSYLQNAKDDSPKFSNANFILGSIYYHRKEYRITVPYLKKVNPTHLDYEESKQFLDDAYFNLGSEELTNGNFQIAIDWFSKVSISYKNYRDVEPGLSEAYKNLGCEHQKKGEFEEAIAAYRKIPEDSSFFKSICLDLAMCCFQMENYQYVIDLLGKFRLYFNQDKVDSILCACYFCLGRNDIGYDIFIKAIIRDSANYYIFRDVFGMIRGVKNSTVELSSNDPEILLDSAVMSGTNLGPVLHGESVEKPVLHGENVEKPDIFDTPGMIFFYSKEYHKAIPCFENIGSDDDSYGRAQLMLGKIYREWGRPLDALKHFDKALKYFKNDPEAQPLYDETQRHIYMIMNFELDEFDIWYLNNHNLKSSPK